MQAPQPQEIVPPNRNRSLTYIRTLEHHRLQKARAIQRVPEFETVEMGVPVRDSKGAIKMKNLLPVVEMQTVLKRDAVAASHDDEIARWEESWEGKKG